MLELKLHCENCKAELPPDSNLAYICSYECTFCHHCAEHDYAFICPNCSGELLRRPARIMTPEKR